MKRINFLMKQNQNLGHDSEMIRKWLGIAPTSLCRFFALPLLFLTLCANPAWAATKTIEVGDFTTCSASEISQEIDGFTFYCENGLIDSESFRAYSGKVFRITSSVGSMSSIVFTFTGTANNRTWGQGTKTYTVSPNSTTWSITGPNQARITKIVITYTPAATCSNKVALTKGSPSNGTFSLPTYPNYIYIVYFSMSMIISIFF